MTDHRILLLSSGSFLADHPEIFGKPFKDLKMVYIPTAAKGASNKQAILVLGNDVRLVGEGDEINLTGCQ